jgi:hypothetical protein
MTYVHALIKLIAQLLVIVCVMGVVTYFAPPWFEIALFIGLIALIVIVEGKPI